MTIKIHDIAKHLNLSNSTVSKALNGYDDVSMTTRELVMKTAVEMGYQPSAAARNLRRGRTDKIGLFLNTSVEYVVDYLSGIISGAVMTAQGLSKNLLIYTIADNNPNQLLKVCRAGEIDGVILFSTHYDQNTIDTLLADNFPFVVMGRAIQDERVSYVVPDYYTGSYQATQYLIDLGHRRIAFTTRPELTTANEARFKGYMDALVDAGLEYDEALVAPTFIEPDSGVQATKQFTSLDKQPTAICAFHDLVAVNVMNTLTKLGYRVPDDVSVMGFDGLRSGLMIHPQITTMAQPLPLIGQRVIEIVNQQIDNDVAMPIQETVPVELVTRQSTATILQRC
ncbi:MAG: LacI family DNA-binding transcriptional regulator [Chloroflexota bacterium]